MCQTSGFRRILVLLVGSGFLLTGLVAGCTHTLPTMSPIPPPETPADTPPPTTVGPTSTPTPVPTGTLTPTKPPIGATGLLAFVGPDDQLWLMQIEGQSQKRITTGGKVSAPAWSPDGEVVGYIYEKEGQLSRQVVLYELDTQHIRTVAPHVSEQWLYETLRRLTWSPNGRYLVLDMGTSLARHLIVIEASTGQLIRELIATGYAWSPDGNRLAFGQPRPLERPISLEDGDSYSLAVLTIGQEEPRLVFEGTSKTLYFPQAWLPDDRLLYERLDWDEETQSAKHSLWTVVLDDGVGEPQPAQGIPPAFDRDAILARLPWGSQDWIGPFSWSTDGRWVVFQVGQTIYLFDWEASGPPYNLTYGSDPAWQPSPGK
jgi:dipeptidyl aminopeptidase/acylaminoacyl peptidase